MRDRLQDLGPLGSPRLLRPLGLGLLLLAVGLAGGDPARAQRALPDPVDEFRKALNTDTLAPRPTKEKEHDKAGKAWADFRQKNLADAARKGRSLGDLRRARM